VIQVGEDLTLAQNDNDETRMLAIKSAAVADCRALAELAVFLAQRFSFQVQPTA